jgi:hypothetical protein
MPVNNDIFNDTLNGGNDILPPYDGNGTYIPFPAPTTSGGGGSYTPPVPINPAYVPPSYVAPNFAALSVTMLSNEIAEFLEDGKTVGYGDSIRLVYSPALQFGNSKIYKVNIANRIASNYYIVSIQKKYRNGNSYQSYQYNYNPYSINDYTTNYLYNTNYNYTYNYNYITSPYQYTTQPSSLDYLYEEVLSIEEYKYDANLGIYQSDSSRVLDATSGIVNLNFTFEPNATTIPDPSIPVETPDDYLVSYEIAFASNFGSELGDILSLDYIVSSDTNDVLNRGTVSLSNGSTDALKLRKSLLEKGSVYFNLLGNLPTEFSFVNLYWTNRTIAEQNPKDYSKWNIVDKSFKLPSKELLNGFILVVELEKTIKVAVPTIKLDKSTYETDVRDSDLDKSIRVYFTTTNSDYVDVYVGPNNYIRVNSSIGYVDLSFNKNFNGIYGSKRVILVSTSELYGTGEKSEIILNFISINDFPSIIDITYADTIDVPSFSDLNIEYDVIYNSFAASSVDVDLLLKSGEYITLFKNLPNNGSFRINLKNLANAFSQWNGSPNVTLKLRPYNRSGDRELIGNIYEIVTNINYPIIQLDETSIRKSIFDAFIDSLKIEELEKESKYLTHLSNFDNNEQILISSWEEDNWTLSEKVEDDLGNVVVKNEVNSLILKLYNPLPANITDNSTFWITKLMAQPLIETVVLNENDKIECPTIKGPNFNIEVDYVKGNSINFESLDTLILSASVSSSADLIQEYLNPALVDYSVLNLEYVSGSDYLWENFVHFSSAKERVDNFVYKVQLIEEYDSQITNAQTSSWVNSIESSNQVERYSEKKRKIIQGFDGFEKFLYTSSSLYTSNDSTSLTWPYSSGTIIPTDDAIVSSWYSNIIELAEVYDINNYNYLNNNLPAYISTSGDNDSFLLFFSMIGHHFDNIYFYTKSIERSRGLGYKSSGNISDKLLYDILKSFSWDAKNLSSNSNLWNLLYGMDSNGNKVQSNPIKNRNYEIWRRIVNNLPYLLKHRGTRRGIYALMSCYGIPSSNLSILEFGGPEAGDSSNKTKYSFDNITTALNFTPTQRILLDWVNTENTRKPDTIEFFAKPSLSGDYTIVSGSGWNIHLSGSANSSYGKVVLNYAGTSNITSSLLPIFNSSFFGVMASRTAGSPDIVTLSVRQMDKDRVVFTNTVSASVTSNWNNGSTISIGNDYVGQLDEFRLWSTPLSVSNFYDHTSFPEMINGNSISASTTDLYLRFDFEYPKNLATYTSVLNVAPRMYYQSGKDRNYTEITPGAQINSTYSNLTRSGSAVGFSSISNYPHQFAAVDRSVVLEIPNIGSSRYSTNKVRFEEQTLVSDLSSKHRSTTKAYDQSPIDSNRVGLFFSPTKELNVDIAKSFGGITLDNYIGNPSDEYSDRYSSLDALRQYYFNRFNNRDIYSYINLIKLYEKSMFDDIKQMLPARVNATTGLLIEPHLLERSKVQYNKPTAENNQYTSSIKYSDSVILNSDINQYETLIDTTQEYSIESESNQYETTITDTTIDTVNSEYYSKDTTISVDENLILSPESYYEESVIDSIYSDPSILVEIDIINSNTIIGQSTYDQYGFGIYAQSGSAIRTYLDVDGKIKKERIKAQLITRQKTIETLKYSKLLPSGLGDIRGGFSLTSSVYTETELNIQPFTGSNGLISNIPTIANDIISVVPLDGYLKSHYRNTTDLTCGLENSFFKGSKNTAATTLDGTPPVEVFITNPNTLRVNKAGRDSNEPILEVE